MVVDTVPAISTRDESKFNFIRDMNMTKSRDFTVNNNVLYVKTYVDTKATEEKR